jgi:hypothetical protein
MSDQGPVTRNIRLAPPANTHADAGDKLSIELDAIITIGRALSHIPDVETRARVMRWAIDRFGIDVTTPEEPGADLALPAHVVSAAAPDLNAAEALNVDGLSEMFPADDEARETRQIAFTSSRTRELRRPRTTLGDRFRAALHWMGI